MKTSYIATGDLFIKEVGGNVVIPLTGLTLLHCWACPRQGHELLSIYIHVPVPGKDMNYCEFISTYVLDWVAQTLLKFKC